MLLLLYMRLCVMLLQLRMYLVCATAGDGV